jgi:glycosyltransferase involved in cell wall biosynthesis
VIHFTVIIPTHNRPRELQECLDALACQDYPKDQFEVIVVDDGSDPPLSAVPGAQFLYQAHAGPAIARNTGAARASGQWLAFTDDDCRPAANWLKVLAGHLTKHPDHLLGGAVINLLADNPYSDASQQLISYLFAYYNSDCRQPRFFTSNNMATSAASFQAAGGFDARLPRAAAEDRELCDRWLHQNRPMTFVPDAIVNHAHWLNFRQFWQQHYNYGRGAHYYHLTRARRGGEPLQIEPWPFYSGLLRFPFGGASPRPFRLAMLLFIAQAANALGFLTERMR